MVVHRVVHTGPEERWRLSTVGGFRSRGLEVHNLALSQLSYDSKRVRDRTWTCDLRRVKPALYQTELPAPEKGAGSTSAEGRPGRHTRRGGGLTGVLGREPTGRPPARQPSERPGRPSGT